MPHLQAAEPAHLRLSSLPPPQNGFGNEGRQGVAVWMPPGRYRLNQTLEIAQSNVVLRGAGVR